MSICTAQSTANASVAATENSALLKSPPVEGKDDKAAESKTTGAELPIQLVPETHKPADTPAATSNGTSNGTADGISEAPTSIGAGVNGTESKPEPLTPEENKQASHPSAAPDTEKPEPSSTDAPQTTASSGTGQPPVMTGANPSASEPEAAGSDQDDGVKDAAAAPAAPAAPVSPVATDKPTELNGGEKKDVDMNDASPAALTSDTAPTTAQDLAPTSKTAETGDKRKADADATNGATATEEPAEKKQKSVVEKIVDKAKDVVEDVKEKTGTATTKDNGPARKASKRGKKDAPPVGRTERKTRSQGRVE